MGRGPSMKAVKSFKRNAAKKDKEGDKRKTNAKLSQRKKEKEDKMMAAVNQLAKGTQQRQKVTPAPARTGGKLQAHTPTEEKKVPTKPSSQEFKKGGKKPGKGKRRILSSGEKHEMKMSGPIGEVLRHCEAFRRDDCEAADKERRVEEVLKLLRKETDGLPALAVKLQTSRVLQSCLKHGTPAQQDSIVNDLKDKLVDLAQNQAASHIFLAAFQNCKQVQLRELVRLICEQTATFVKHRVAVRVLEAAFLAANRTQQKAFVVYAVGRPDITMESNKGEKSLEEVWEAQPRGKSVSLQSLFGRVDAAVSHHLVHYGIVHRLLDVYFTHGMHDQCVELGKGLAEHVVHFCNDQNGSKVALKALEYCGPEERKTLVAKLADHILPLSCGRFSYLLASRIVDVVEDTNDVRDTFLRELVRERSEGEGEGNLPAIQTLVTSVAGSKVLLHLLTPSGDRKKLILQPAHSSLLWALQATKDAPVNADVTIKVRRPGAGAISEEDKVIGTNAGPRHDLALAFLLRPNSASFQGTNTAGTAEVGLLDLVEGGDVNLLLRDTQARRVMYELLQFSRAVPKGWKVTAKVLEEAKKTLASIDEAYKAVHTAMEKEGKKRKAGGEAEAAEKDVVEEPKGKGKPQQQQQPKTTESEAPQAAQKAAAPKSGKNEAPKGKPSAGKPQGKSEGNPKKRQKQ